MKQKSQSWLPMLIAVILVIGMFAGYKLRERVPLSQGFLQTGQRSSLQEVIDLIQLQYVDPLSTDSLTDDAIQAMLSHLDPHSVYIPKKYLQEVNEDLQGNFEGIGVEFQIIRDTVNVVSVLPGGPSEAAGLKVGDRFLKVGDSLVAGTGITPAKIKSLLRGPGKSVVRITVLTAGDTREVAIERGTIPLYSVDASYLIDDTTGFIHLNKFSETTYEEFMSALEKLNKEGMKKLILDLRDNGGGILNEAVDISDEFLSEEKLIVYTKGDKQERLEYKCKRPGLFEQGSLVILVDEGSASASEVVAGAIQDWDRGTIIGRRTFGKGLVQQQFRLSGGGALRLTVARYYTPTGRSIQKSYSSGRGAYDEEVYARFHNGEMISSDSAEHPSGKPFKTKGGRTVYGGGGIMPDVFVPYDTTGLSTAVYSLFDGQHFGKFIYQYYIGNQDRLGKFRNPREFLRNFHPGEETLKSLMDYAAENDLELPELPARDREELLKRIKTWMARQIWGMPGYYEVSNEYDRTVQRALTLNGSAVVR